MPKTERRYALTPRAIAQTELRSQGDQPQLITGYGAVYFSNADAATQYQIEMDLVERLRPGCFDAFLASDRDCICAPYHDERRILGRRSRLLKIASDDKGLRYSLPYDDTDPDHVAIAAKLRRGDVQGSSIDFAVLEENWSRDEETDIIVREVIRAELYHLGPVLNEAYPGTTAEIRSAENDGWDYLQERKARYLAHELAGYDELSITIEALLAD